MRKVNGRGRGVDMVMGSANDYEDEVNRSIRLNRSCDDISGRIQVLMSFKNQRTAPWIKSSTNTPLMPKKPCEIDDDSKRLS